MNFVLYVHDTTDTPVWPLAGQTPQAVEAQVAKEIGDLVESYTTGLVTVDAIAGVFIPLDAARTALDALGTWLDDIDIGLEEDSDRVPDIEEAADAITQALRDAGASEDEEDEE